MSPRLLLALLFASLSIGAILSGPPKEALVPTPTPSPPLVVEASTAPKPTETPASASLPASSGEPESGLSAIDLLSELTLTGERREGYDRDRFRHWIDADLDGCDTRREVLIAESRDIPAISSLCTITGGSWQSAYDGAVTVDPIGFDIDHLVPLAEAWDSGAWGWNDARREAFANDLGDPRSLIAVSARSNRSKSDRDPGEWLPDEEYRCRYAADWVAVKLRWSLSIDSFEQGALIAILRGCPAEPLSFEVVP